MHITSVLTPQSSSASNSLKMRVLHIIPLLVARCTDQGTRNQEAMHRKMDSDESKEARIDVAGSK